MRERSSKLGVWIAPLLALLALGAPRAAAGEDALCRITAVVDAATLRLACAGGDRMVRLDGVRAPRPGLPQEGGEPYGSDSRELARRELTGRSVVVAAAGGLKWLAVDGVDLRGPLLASGMIQTTAAGRRRLAAALLAAERSARAGQRGLWSYEAWRRHREAARSPFALVQPPPKAPESAAGRAARAGDKPWQERKAAFEAALAELERAQEEAAPATPADPP